MFGGLVSAFLHPIRTLQQLHSPAAASTAAAAATHPCAPALQTSHTNPFVTPVRRTGSGGVGAEGHDDGHHAAPSAAAVAPAAGFTGGSTEAAAAAPVPAAGAHKRSAAVADGDAAAAANGHGVNGVPDSMEQLERDAGRQSKRVRTGAASSSSDPSLAASAAGGGAGAATGWKAVPPAAAATAAAAPRAGAPSRSLSSVAAATASIFNFGPLHPSSAAPLFASKHRPGGAQKKHAGKAGHSRNNSSAALLAEQLAASLDAGVRITSGATSPAPMEDVAEPVVTSANGPSVAANGAAAAAGAAMPSSRDSSPSHVLQMPLHGLSIRSGVSHAAFGAMSLSDQAAAANPFASAAAHTASREDPATIAARRAAEQRAARSSKLKADQAQVKRDRVAALSAAAARDAAREGRQRPDIKSFEARNGAHHVPTTSSAAAATSTRTAHLPLRPSMFARSVHVRPPVPPFDAAAPAPSATAAVAAGDVRDGKPSDRDRDRTPITAAASTEAARAREDDRRAEREARQEAEAKIARERAAQKRRDAVAQEAARKKEELAAVAQAAQAAQQAAEAAARAEATAHAEAVAAAATAAAAASAAAATARPQGLRRSARHSFSPSAAAGSAASSAAAAAAYSSSSPSPSPPPDSHGMATPLPKNRFAAPPLSASEAITPGPAPAAHTRSLRSQINQMHAAASATAAVSVAPAPDAPSPRAAAAAARVAAAAMLAENIASRKAAEARASAARLLERQQVLAAQARTEARAAEERDQWQDRVARNVAARARGKGYLDLLAEFAPTIRAELAGQHGHGGRPSFDAQRKAMRRALARFHPDKHTSSPTKNKLEAEEIFVLLKRAYDELNNLCR